MRIVYFNYEWDLERSTGSATQIAETSAALERLGHKVVVIDRHRKQAQRNAVKAPGHRHNWLWETANYWRSVRGVPLEINILRRERPDVVLTFHAHRFSSLIAARRLGIPIVFEVNASVPFETRRFHPQVHLLPGVSEWIEDRTLRAADRLMMVSNVLRDYFLARGLPRERMAVIPNGADTNLFRPEAADQELRRRLPARLLIGFAGSFAPFHGLDLLQQAVLRISARHPEVHFVFAGGGPAAEALRKRWEANGCASRVTFLGLLPRKCVPGMLAAMDILLAPYPAQNVFYFSPLKIFEYMACGRAVVAPRLGQVAEVIRHDYNGVLYDPARPDDFVNQVLSLAQDPNRRMRLGAAARETIISQYTWDHHARLLAALLEQAVARPSTICWPNILGAGRRSCGAS
ncbi:MAG TPA: glycosyltransferase family 4 protein [Bryobacterales bacterium]|jgi:glycosyltransferase involved in cell wall biosynthesis|nr:glycosyltransferase family 4 protein [Bryobacterales bacterium]